MCDRGVLVLILVVLFCSGLLVRQNLYYYINTHLICIMVHAHYILNIHMFKQLLDAYANAIP